jgi:hypothetical protein
MKQILDVPLGSGEESTRFEKAHRLKFSDEAAALFEEGINRWTDSFRSPTSPDFSMKSWMAKARGRAARIACVLHAMHRCGEPGWYELQVEPQQVRDALHLVEAFYKQHAKYAYRMMGVFRATKVDAAKEALHWMIRQKTDETGLISHRRLQQSLKNSIGGKEELIECLKLLEERGWIATVWPAPDQVRGRGAKCPLGYRLNPRAQVAMKRVGPVE